MTEAQQAAFQRATLLLTDIRNLEGAFPPGTQSRSFHPWASRDDVGIQVPGAVDWLTDARVAWFRERGWLAVSMKTDVFVAPFVEVTPPMFCYHVTPASNETGVLERGLLRGVDAGRSTTGRRDAGQRIHLSFDAETAALWAKDDLLGQHHVGG